METIITATTTITASDDVTEADIIEATMNMGMGRRYDWP